MEIDKKIWILLNVLLIIYAIILLIYGKYVRKKESYIFVKYNFYNKIFLYTIYLQKSYIDGDKGLFDNNDKIFSSSGKMEFGNNQIEKLIAD